jgi:hypothetical protein
VQSCGHCSRIFDPGTVLDWTWNGQQVQMHPSYEAERRGLAERFAPGRPDRLAGPVAARSMQPGPPAITDPVVAMLPVGTRVRLRGRGKYAGSSGKIIKIGRSRYHVKTSKLLLTAPFAMVEKL